jgi:hypothetical protein
VNERKKQRKRSQSQKDNKDRNRSRQRKNKETFRVEKTRKDVSGTFYRFMCFRVNTSSK